MIAWKPHWVDHRDCFPEAALPVAQDSHRDVCSREQRRSKRSSCVNLLLTMMSAIISENMQLVAGDFNSGAGATPGELCGSLKPPHSHCWKIPNMVPGVREDDFAFLTVWVKLLSLILRDFASR